MMSLHESTDISVWFVGAGPGDPDLLTVKGRRLIESADVLLYPGSLTPPAIVALANPGADVVDTAPLALEQTHAIILDSVARGGRVVRLQAGDPALYGTILEQTRLLHAAGVSWGVVPGVTSASAAAAAAGISLSVPERNQTLILTRLAGRTPVPEAQSLSSLARHGAAMAVYLSGDNPEGVRQACLEGGMPPETPVCLAHRLGWEGETLRWTTLEDLPAVTRAGGWTRQTLFLVLPGRETDAHTRSRLYDPAFAHGWRAATTSAGPEADSEN